MRIKFFPFNIFINIFWINTIKISKIIIFLKKNQFFKKLNKNMQILFKKKKAKQR